MQPSRINDHPSLPDSAWRRRFRRRLRSWYARHARKLPWRENRDPYLIWISEIMLQQTQVATVSDYFQRFQRRFPTIHALADANEEEVLRAWEGLGYYRRARQLHQAAGIIVDEHGGQFPRDPDEVRRLPGIGRYTAGAVLSIAFDARQPILEANTTRLFARLLAYRGNPTAAAGSRLLWSMAEAVLPRGDVGRFNQALMELGGQVCTARRPRCHECPVAPLCEARTKGEQESIPAAKVKRPLEDRHEVALIVRRRGRVLLVRCPEGGRWGGLWDFPRFQVFSEHPTAVTNEVAENVKHQTGLIVEPGKHLKTIKHGVTRFRITLDCYDARYVSGTIRRADLPGIRWVKPSELDDYPLSTTGRTMSRLVGC